MKKTGIIVITFILTFLLTACTSNELSFFECVYSNKCSSSLITASSNPDDEVIIYLNEMMKTELAFDYLEKRTTIDYTEYDSGDTRIVIQYYTDSTDSRNYHIDEFNVLFNKLSDYIIGKGADYDTFKVELKTVESFTKKSIALYDGEKVYSSLNASFTTYDKLTEEDRSRLQEDISYSNMFDRFSYNFMYETISILFSQNMNDQGRIRLKIVHRDSNADFYIPRDQIHSTYQNILADVITVILEEDE